MPWRKILVASDLTEASQPALREAFDIARRIGGGLLVLHVTGPAGAPLGEQERAGAARVLDAQIAELGAELDDGADAEIKVIAGHAADAILATARDWHAELIVVGTHGRHGVRRAMLGSVAESVVRAAPCPVLTVRARA